MFRKKSIRVTALMCMLALPFAAAAKEKKTYNVSAFSYVTKLPANTAASDKARQNAHNVFPDWMCATDRVSGNAADIYGAPVAIDGNSLSEKAANIISEKLSGMGIVANEWQIMKQYTAPKANYVQFKQVVNGHTVVFASMNFRFTKSGDIARIQMKNYGASTSGAVSITREAAGKAAVSDIAGLTVTSSVTDAEWSWFPVPRDGGYTLHPAWHFKVKADVKGSVPLILTGYVDATTGDILYRTNDVKETSFNLTVKGMVYPHGTLHPASLEPLTDLYVTDYINLLTTDTAGYCSTPLWTLPFNTNVQLAGNWSTVFDDPTSTTPEFPTFVTVPGSTYTFPTTSPSSNRHVNAYYHVNKVHNFMKGFFPSFTDMDFSLPTNVDLTSGTCNAFYNGSSINFFAADATCNSFAEIGDIIYHEYGHGISDHFYQNITGSTIMNGALNEANSDIWALSITHNPVLGENSFVGYGGFIRRYDQIPQVYPIDWNTGPMSDPHYNGEIIAGCWWDVGVNIGSADSMAKLFTDVYYSVPDGPDGTEGMIYNSILISTLLADDNDANLANGTPHYNKIVAAFAKHGIYLEGETVINHTEPTNPLSGMPILVTASLTLDNPSYAHDMALSYRINGAGSWITTTTTASGSTYTGTIPAQVKGTTVEYYFTLHDNLGAPNAYFPISCNPTLIAEYANMPYQFGVDLTSVIGNDFEGSTTGWNIGGNPGDNATDGLWIVAAPVASSNTFYTLFPNYDHTTGMGKCLIAGWGGGSGGGTTITQGTTTVLSPSFDISAFHTPVVQYYRWFSNEQGYDNFKNDPWIVQVRSSSTGAWQTVERTYQGELKWRRRIFPVQQYLPAPSTHIQLKFTGADSVLSTWSDAGQSLTTANVDDVFIFDRSAAAGVENTVAARAEINPNPADRSLNITLQGTENTGTIALYDMTGKSVITNNIEAGRNSYTLNTQSIAPGIYNLVIQTGKSIECRQISITH